MRGIFLLFPIYLTNMHATRGFIALMSAVIMSALLLALLFASNTLSFYSRFDERDAHYHQVALALAQSCQSEALLQLAQNHSYDPVGQVFTKSAGQCSVESILPHAPRVGTSSILTVLTRGSYHSSYSAVESVVV